MELTEKAKYFAINAHKGQVRKSEPDKPMIIHPISVGELLKEYGCDSPYRKRVEAMCFST